MKTYIVGGWNRDTLMGLTPKDKDFLIVGASENDIKCLLTKRKFKQVGADFPVFIAPNGDEYALARIERKSGVGYNGFEVETKGVTLEQDLSRRDFTMNAIAYDINLKQYTDPYNGIKDINDKTLRHVSDAFREDPVRVLRAARFLARYDGLKIHASTLNLIEEMVKGGELEHLTNERVLLEVNKAIAEGNPETFFRFLNDQKLFEVIFPTLPVLKKTDFTTINRISHDGTFAHQHDFIWAVLVDSEESLLSMRLPHNTNIFINTYLKHKDDFITIRKKSAGDITKLFKMINIKNKGGEEFLYKLTELLILNRFIDYELEDFIIKAFDAYSSVELNVEELVSTGQLLPRNIPDYVFSQHLEQIKKFLNKG